jgi:hypothetical protein
VTDRYEPHSFANVGTFAGRTNVLGIEINSAENLANRPASYQFTFYNTQGRQHVISGGPSSTLSADLYIPASWGNAANGNVRSDEWGVMRDALNNISAYPILGFTNFGGAPRFRAWDDDINDWVNLASPVLYDAWNALKIAFTGASFDYYVNGALAFSDLTTDGSTGFSATIMQAYNFADPSIIGTHPIDYVAHWSNVNAFAVPEPATLSLIGIGLAAFGVARRRTKQ